MLKSLSESHELSHCLSLELFNVFVLLLQLTVSTVLECTEFERFVCAFIVNFLLQVVLAIVDFLHDILLSFDTRLNLAIELILETCKQKYVSIIMMMGNSKRKRELLITSYLSSTYDSVCLGSS
jgi:hypothetical protein